MQTEILHTTVSVRYVIHRQTTSGITEEHQTRTMKIYARQKGQTASTVISIEMALDMVAEVQKPIVWTVTDMMTAGTEVPIMEPLLAIQHILKMTVTT